MRSLFFCFCVLLLLPNPVTPQMGHAKPPGITTADTMANAPMEAPAKFDTRKVNLDQVNAETQELRKLVDSLQPQMEQVNKGQLPKDLTEDLKKIEKLAKHLRSEVSP
jgi:hypothetical protein